MKIRYIYSACIVIETEDVSVLCDPWFTPGADGGSWAQYPPLDGDPIDVIGLTDVIYISHTHSDHYDPIFLRRYLEKFPNAELLITTEKLAFLEMRMKADGFTPTVAKSKTYGETILSLVPNYSEPFDHDTALVVVRGDQSVANMNDNHFDPKQIAEVKRLCPGGRPDFAALAYTGAGPFPQTYHFDDPEDRKGAEQRKMHQFLSIYESFVDALDPKIAFPFAGTYFLMGPLSELNDKRGANDATAVLGLENYGDRSVVLADGGYAEFDLDTMTATATRTEPYDKADVQAFLDGLPFEGYHHELEFRPLGNRPIPLMRVLRLAYQRAISRSPSDEVWWLCFKSGPKGHYFAMNTAEDFGVREIEDVNGLTPRWEIHIDERLLFLTLCAYYHWEEVEGGSHFYCVREPNRFNQSVSTFLAFMTI